MKQQSRRGPIFVSWAPYCSRSDTLAQRFGAESHLIHYLGFKQPWLAPVKYLIQAAHTLALCIRKRPRIVFVMNPPVFAGLVVYLYTRLFGGAYILDTHTGSFIEKKWTRFNKLHWFLARRARVSIVTNDELGRRLADIGAQYFVIPDVPVEFDEIPEYRLDHPHITVVNTFSFDEPVENILEAAQQLPQVNFSVTGSLKHAPQRLLDNLPANVRFTDFLSKSDYVGMLAASDAVLVLTTQNHTMQRGAYEAMSLKVPVITSDWPLLRETFSRGTVYTDNSPSGIREGVAQLLEKKAFYKEEIGELKRQRRALWRELEETFAKTYLNDPDG